MENITQNEVYQPLVNSAMLIGTPAEAPVFSHFGGEDEYQTFPMDIERLSGTSDRINITARKTDLNALYCDWTGSERLMVSGEVRSFNNVVDAKTTHLIVTVLASEIRYAREYEIDSNGIQLRGFLCKKPIYRLTPMGRQICDIMLAVNTHPPRADYLPCIAWGRVAMILAEREIGSPIALFGRIQSRRYTKKIRSDKDENVIASVEERVTFEISVVRLDENADMPVLDE